MDNKELIQKADWAIGDLTASSGLLSPEQTNTFIRKLVHTEPTILRDARVVTMTGPTRKINKIGFATRILQPAVSATALIAADRSKPTTEQIELNTKEVIAEVRLPYDVIEDNIESGRVDDSMATGPASSMDAIKDTIMTLIAKRAATDLEELAILGDTASGDTYLALTDGYLKLAVTNVVNANAATISKAVFKAGIKAMPDQYLRNLASLRHYVSVDNEIEYRDTLANRETALGDNTIQGINPVFGFGVPVNAAPLMPAANGLLVDPLNLIMGIQRKIMIEADKDISARVYKFVLTARVDFQIEEETAIVKYTNIG